MAGLPLVKSRQERQIIDNYNGVLVRVAAKVAAGVKPVGLTSRFHRLLGFPRSTG